MTITVVMVSIECTCVAFLMVVLLAYIVLPRSGKLWKDGFFLCLVSTILGIVFDTISWICESVPSARWLQYSSNTLCLVTSGIMASFFAYYIIGLIREKKPVSWLYARIIAIANICGAVIVIIAACCGKLYVIVPYPVNPEIMIYLSGGFLYDIPNYLSTLSLLALFVITLRNTGALGIKKVIILSLYFLMPLLAGGLELINESLQFSYIVTAINMSIVYVMLQSNHMNNMRLREELLKEWSYMDSLTGLLNRRAFDRDAEKALKDDTVGIAFCDLNGLKKVNDEKGHSAGDQYLMNFSGMLTRHFSRDCVYRISGDEFVVIARGIGNAEFNSSIEGLRQEIDENSSIAAIGTADGSGENIFGLMKDAEAKMYDDKKNFYRKNPDCKYRRFDS